MKKNLIKGAMVALLCGISFNAYADILPTERGDTNWKDPLADTIRTNTQVNTNTKEISGVKSIASEANGRSITNGNAIDGINADLNGQNGLKQRVQNNEKLSADNATKINNVSDGLSDVRSAAEIAQGTADDNTKKIETNTKTIGDNLKAQNSINAVQDGINQGFMKTNEAQDGINKTQGDINGQFKTGIHNNAEAIGTKANQSDMVEGLASKVDNQKLGNLGSQTVKDYADGVGANANAHTDTVMANAKATGKNYVDGSVADASAKGKTYVDTSIGSAKQQGKKYVDDKWDAVNADINSRFDTAKNYVDNGNKQTLKSANDYTDKRYNQLNGKLKKVRARADAGVAGATAIASLPFRTDGKNSVAGGLGVAKNKVAGAIGYQHNFNKSWSARATIAVSDNYVQGGTGASYTW